MKFLVLFLSAAFVSANEHRGLGLAADWNIDGPGAGFLTYTPDDKTFHATFTHGVGTGAGNADLKVYRLPTPSPVDGEPERACPSVAGPNAQTAEFTNPNVEDDSFLTPPLPPAFTPGATTSTYEFQLDNDVASLKPEVYKNLDDGSHAIVSFCLYFALQDEQTVPPGGNNELVDVSFMQVGVQINLNLDAGFSQVDSFLTIAAAASKADTTGGVFGATAVPCDPDDARKYKNNEVISLCICPDNANNQLPTYASDVRDLSVTSALGMSQIIIENGDDKTAAVKEDCNLQTGNHIGCCRVRVILNAVFFPLQETFEDASGSTFNIGNPAWVEVEMTGSVWLQLDMRRRDRNLVRTGDSRALEVMYQPVEAKFETKLDLEKIQPQATASGGGAAAQTIASFLAVAGAVLAL